MKAEKETLVLGVGNLLLKDEGVGIHAVSYTHLTLPTICSV